MDNYVYLVIVFFNLCRECGIMFTTCKLSSNIQTLDDLFFCFCNKQAQCQYGNDML